MCWVKRLLLGAAVSAAVSAVATVGVAMAAPPSNDRFAGASVISSVPFTTSEDTTGATLDDADTAAGTACGVAGISVSNSVWFAYTPPSDQVVRIDTSSSTYGVVGAVLTSSPSSFSAVSCFYSGSSFQAQAGTTYNIALLQNPAGSEGTLNLSLTPLVAPNPAVSVDPSGSFDSKSGAATVSGTESCGAGAFAFISAGLTQSVGRIATISGGGGPTTPIVCDGNPHPWSAVVVPQSGLFKGGKATATITMYACSFTCDVKNVTQAIQLKR